MNKYNTYLDNLNTMKHLRIIDTIIVILIFALNSISLVYSFIALFVPTFDVLAILFDGIILKIAHIAAAYIGIYKRNFIMTVTAPLFPSMCILIFSFSGYECSVHDMNIMIAPIAVCIMIASLYSNYKYAYLEQQEGFPYFNERFENQKSEAVRFNEKNPYTAMSEERKKTECDHMDDLF